MAIVIFGFGMLVTTLGLIGTCVILPFGYIYCIYKMIKSFSLRFC